MNCFWWVVIYSYYVLCPNYQNACQWKINQHFTLAYRMWNICKIYWGLFKIMVKWYQGRLITKLIVIYVTHKSKQHQVTQTKSSFLFFPFRRWIICLVRKHSLNLHIFVFRSGYSRKRVKRLQNLQKEHTPKQLGTWSLFLLPSGLVLSREKRWLGFNRN